MKLSKLNITVPAGIMITLVGCGILFLEYSRLKIDSPHPSVSLNAPSSTSMIVNTSPISQGKGVQISPVDNQKISRVERVSLTILFSRHIRSADILIALLNSEISKANIILIEQPTWSSYAEEEFNAISRGEKTATQLLTQWQITPEQQNGDDWQFLKYLMDIFYQSNIYITSVDLMQDEVLSQNIRNAVTALPQINGNNFKQVLQNHKQKFTDFTTLTIQRENMMVDRYQKLVKSIQDGLIPQVQGKDNVNILYILGVNHVRVFDLLKEKGLDVSKIFSYDPYTYNYSGEVTVKLLSQQPISDDLFARQLFESAFEKFIAQSWLDNDQKSSRLERKIISQFSFEELESIFNAMLNSQDQYSTFSQSLISIAKQKNIAIPLSKAEFNAYDI